MEQWSTVDYVLLAALAVLYAIACWRVAIQAGKLGLSPVKWFFISFFFTAIPAVFAFSRRRQQIDKMQLMSPPTAAGMARPSSNAAVRCRNCGRVVAPIELAGAQPVCPRCKQALDQEHLA